MKMAPASQEDLLQQVNAKLNVVIACLLQSQGEKRAHPDSEAMHLENLGVARKDGAAIQGRSVGAGGVGISRAKGTSAEKGGG